MAKKKILVIGSSNTDMVIKTTKLPAPGETILGGDFFMNQGGKGSNQAVAAARLGGKVIFVAKTGNDIFGSQAKRLLKAEKIDTRFVLTDHGSPSGVALITVNAEGENCIVVAPGSNGKLTVSDIDLIRTEIMHSGIVLMQLEIPVETVKYVAEIAFKAGIKVILNPAPAIVLPDDLFRKVYLLTPNETEAELFTGVKIFDQESARQAAIKLIGKGVQVVILTMGNKGAFICNSASYEFVPAQKVKAIDTTGAGDVFNGALAVAISEGISLRDSVEFASKAAAISVTRLGAQTSAPYRKEII